MRGKNKVQRKNGEYMGAVHVGWSKGCLPVILLFFFHIVGLCSFLSLFFSFFLFLLSEKTDKCHAQKKGNKGSEKIGSPTFTSEDTIHFAPVGTWDCRKRGERVLSENCVYHDVLAVKSTHSASTSSWSTGTMST